MTTYSTVLKLELPGDGQQVGTWGQTTNKNFGTLVEQAITGVRTINMIDANYTLTDLNGTTDEARNAVIVATGTNNAVRKIVIPLNNKVYTISNQTTGGYAIQIGAVTGNYVTVPNGVVTSVYCDGTNTLTGINGATDSFFVNGTLTVSANANVVGNTSLIGTLGVGGAAAFTNTVGFSVTPTAPTQSPGTNTTQLATTAFVQNVAGNLGTMSTQNANNVAITGGTINGTTIGASTAAAITGTTVTASSQFSGPGTGLTGTASSLTVGAAVNATNSTNATNATNATNVVSGGTIASNVTATTQVVGTSNTTVATTAFVRSIIPAGVIMLWSGSVASIPSGWYLCDGNNSTPDLRNRFIVGAGSTYAVAATGGSADATLVSHTHTATVSDPTHNHSASSSVSDPGHSHSFGSTFVYNVPSGSQLNIRGDYNAVRGDYTAPVLNAATTGVSVSTTNTAASTGISVSNSSSGSSATNANLPPYYALAYIMKA